MSEYFITDAFMSYVNAIISTNIMFQVLHVYNYMIVSYEMTLKVHAVNSILHSLLCIPICWFNGLHVSDYVYS